MDCVQRKFYIKKKKQILARQRCSNFLYAIVGLEQNFSKGNNQSIGTKQRRYFFTTKFFKQPPH